MSDVIFRKRRPDDAEIYRQIAIDCALMMLKNKWQSNPDKKPNEAPTIEEWHRKAERYVIMQHTNKKNKIRKQR